MEQGASYRKEAAICRVLTWDFLQQEDMKNWMLIFVIFSNKDTFENKSITAVNQDIPSKLNLCHTNSPLLLTTSCVGMFTSGK